MKNSSALIVMALAALLLLAASVASPASAANRCTRYAGYPRGVWNSTTCASRTGWDFFAVFSPYQTSSTALRDANQMKVQNQVCAPTRLHVWVWNPSTSNSRGSDSSFCAIGWLWNDQEQNGYSYALCELANDNGSQVTDNGECYVTWSA
jgi:hypothetical protein